MRSFEMDPDATLCDLLAAMLSSDWDLVDELQQNLIEWMDHQGFPPLTIGPKELGASWHKSIAMVVCQACRVKVQAARRQSSRRTFSGIHFTDRAWCVQLIDSAEVLALKLATQTWTLCSAFQIGNYVWLNDSVNDSLQVYAVVKRQLDGSIVQIESTTVSWCDPLHVQQFIEQVLEGQFDRHARRLDIPPGIESRQQHGRCQHCA